MLAQRARKRAQARERALRDRGEADQDLDHGGEDLAMNRGGQTDSLYIGWEGGREVRAIPTGRAVRK